MAILEEARRQELPFGIEPDGTSDKSFHCKRVTVDRGFRNLFRSHAEVAHAERRQSRRLRIDEMRAQENVTIPESAQQGVAWNRRWPLRSLDLKSVAIADSANQRQLAIIVGDVFETDESALVPVFLAVLLKTVRRY